VSARGTVERVSHRRELPCTALPTLRDWLLRATPFSTAATRPVGLPHATTSAYCILQDDDGWGYVQFRREEVSDVITSLTSRPRITELVSDDGSTTDGEADRAFHRAEPYHGDETVNNVTTVVTNLLNDPVAGAAVQQALFNDPTFRSMVRQETGACLPPPAARPLLTGPERSAPGDDANLFAAVGSALEAILSKLANSCVALGSVLRRLPEDLRTVL